MLTGREIASSRTIDLPRAEAEPLDAGLYLVATPIGNLQDITLRALRVLKGVDRIACEDTRLTQKLLNYFAISVATVSCHEHNELARTAELLELLRNGGRVAMVSDAGMPGISDPGMRLARAAIDAGIRVIPVPGANAALTALIASGFGTEHFFYAGFLPAKAAPRREELTELGRHCAATRHEALTLVLYEAPHRILETLADVEAVWGATVRVVVARELTKRHEEFIRGTVAEVRSVLSARERVRGEIVLLIEPIRIEGKTDSGASVSRLIAELTQSEGMEEKDALKRVARERGTSKSAIYRELQRERGKR